MQVTATDGDTVDLLCWQHYGRTQGVVEAVYQANPHLCESHPALSVGQIVTMPDLQPPAQQDIIQLWD
ncbi:tail protein X [Hafnia alvei]|uniref:tail protein X n=1 Tax=Hafnia alvei TaxID=569 RepID=UPI000B70AF36|nr:tail protein X [Hafnia alvei]MBI0277276.1 tail protein X [Hafnia alvei]PNK97564.1 phage tail protein [Hafnia alvei]